ncbi:predicted phosphohydrolase, MPP superfamily [Bacteroidales bacterium 6E]|nr:predicted phosphohydrolase, MPP superfamily [Bacteroidales bacterium 6E]
MFHLYLMLAYTIPNIYVFFRIMYLFIGKGYRLTYTVIYLLLAAVYPATRYLSHLLPDRLEEALSVVANYLLPFYLYVFLFLLLYELFLLLNAFLRLVSKEKRKSGRFRLTALASIILLSLAVVTGGIINMNTIRASHYNIVVPQKDSPLNHLRIAFVADLHLMENSSLEFVEQYVRKVNALKPDIVLYGGDIVEGRDENRISEAILAALRKVQSRYGSFGVPGNHESYGSRGNGTFYERAGINLLLDTLVNVDNSFYLAGRLDERSRNRKSAAEIMDNLPSTPPSKLPSEPSGPTEPSRQSGLMELAGASDISGQSGLSLPVIMLDHRPTQLQEVSQTPVDVQFSGHTHNGQLFPINLYMRTLYELSWGHKQIRDTHFFVTSGLRLWGPPVKTAGKSEIMVVDVRFE